jgi:hypothetical protein
MINESFGNPIFTTKLSTMGCSVQREDAKMEFLHICLGTRATPC